MTLTVKLRPKYHRYLAWQASKHGLTEDRVIELALASYQLDQIRYRDGYRQLWIDKNNKLHPLDVATGCMGDE